MPFLDGLDIQPTPSPASPATTTPGATKGFLGLSVKQNAPDKQPPTPTPSPYFSAVDAQGNSFGFSDTETDPSGRPLFAYREPGDTSTTTDQTRVATKIDPRVATTTSRDDIYNPRDNSGEKAQRQIQGAGPNDQIDHRMALALSGSNEPANMKSIPSSENQADGTYEKYLADSVHSGSMSLFDAQKLEAQHKGLKQPFTGTQPPSTWDKVTKFLQDSVGKAGHVIQKGIDDIKAAVAPKQAQAADTGFMSGLDVQTPDTTQPVPPQPQDTGFLGLKTTPLLTDHPSPVGPLDTKTEGSTAEEGRGGPLNDAFDFFFKTQPVTVQPAFSKPSEAIQVPGTKVAEAVYNLFNRTPEFFAGVLPKVAAVLMPGQVSGTPFNMDAGRLTGAGGVEGDKTLQTFGQDYLNSWAEADANSGIDPKKSLDVSNPKSLMNGVTSAGWNIIIPALTVADLGVGAHSLSESALESTGYSRQTLDSLKNIGINPDELKLLPPEKASALVTEQAKQRFQEILSQYPEVGDGTVPKDAVAELNALGDDVKRIGDEYRTNTESFPNRLGSTIRKVADTLTTPISDLGNEEPFRSTPDIQSEPALPGQRARPGQARPLGASLSEEESVGRASKDVETAVAARDNAFKDFNDVSTKVLGQLEGKTSVSSQFISDLTNSPDLKQPERQLIRDTLADFPKDKPVPVADFAQAVHDKILKLDATNVAQPKYESVSLPNKDRGQVADYNEKIYQSPVKTSAASTHFPSEKAPNYFAHTRTEDLPKEGTSKEALALQYTRKKGLFKDKIKEENLSGPTRRVLELQSDLFQKGRLEREGPIRFSMLGDQRGKTFLRDKFGNVETPNNRGALHAREKELQLLEPYRNTWHERIIREEIKKAAEDGKTKLQFPTGETAMKIEGLGQENNRFFLENKNGPRTRLTIPDLKIGRAFAEDGGTDWVVTNVSGASGSFKAVQKNVWDSVQAELTKPDFKVNETTIHQIAQNQLFRAEESFDISDKVDTENPIYKFYEKEIGRYLTNKYGATRVTDAQGVSWYEVPIKPEMADEPVRAFKKTGASEITPKTLKEVAKHSPFDMTIEQGLKEARKFFTESEVDFLFPKNLIDHGIDSKAIGMFQRGRVFRNPLIQVLQADGKIQSKVLYHEMFHAYFQEFIPKEERVQILKNIRSNVATLPQRTMKWAAYHEADTRAEEYAADDFADYVAGKSYVEANRSLYQRIVDQIKEWIRKLSKLEDVYDRIINNERNYRRPTTRTMNGAGEDVSFKKIREPSDYSEANQGSKERDVQERKEAEQNKPETPLEKRLSNLRMEREGLQTAVESNPARQLSKYANANGELPEVHGLEGGKFRMTGDEYASELGYKDSEEARTAYANYKVQQQRLNELNAEIAKARKDVASARAEDKDAKSMNHLLERQTRKTAVDVAKNDRIASLKKADAEGAVKAQQEKNYQELYQAKVNAARLEAKQGRGIFQKIKDILKPIKSVDPVTRNILTRWFEKKLVGKELAQQAFLDSAPKGPQNFQEITDYQAGKQTPYIRDTFDALQTEAKRRGLDFKYKDNYLPQVYENKSTDQNIAINKYLKDQGMSDADIAAYLNGEPVPEQKSLRLKINPNFSKPRFWPDYATAMKYGLKPKYRTPAQLVAYYRQEMENAIANRELVSELKAEAKVLPFEDAPDTWKPLTSRFSPRESLYAQLQLADLINGKFRDEENLSPFQTLNKGFATVSRVAQRFQLSAGVPFTNINFHSIGQLYKAINTGLGELGIAAFKTPVSLLKGEGMPVEVRNAISSFKTSGAFVRSNSNKLSEAWFNRNERYIALMAKHDIDISGRTGNYENLYKTFGDLFPIPKTPTLFGREFPKLAVPQAKAIGIKNALGVGFYKAFGEKTFNSYMGMIHVQLFKDSFEGGIRDGLPEEEAAKFAAELVKNYDGLVGELGRSKTTKESLSGLFYAQPYRESLINSFVKTGPAWTTQFKNPTYGKSRALLLGAAITFAIYNMLNKKLSGNWMWENPPGHELQLRIPRANGDVAYVDYFPGTALIRNAIEGGFAFAKGDIKTAGGKFVSTFSLPVQIIEQLATNMDYFGRPIFTDADSLAVKVAKGAAYTFLGVDNPYIRDSYMAWTGQEPLYQAMTRMAALPAKFGTMSKEGTALAIAHQNQIGSLYLQLQDMKADGQADEANQIWNNLSDADKKIYNTYRSKGKAAATKALYAPTRVLYDQNQRLKADGKTDEANAIYDALPAPQQKIYDQIKAEAALAQ